MNLSLLQWLTPWEFSPTLLLAFALSGWLFWRGSRLRPIHWLRHALFWGAWVMLYLAMHTHLDYYAERMFFVHRAQHVFLHHIAPLLIMAAYPLPVLKAGLPTSWRRPLYHFMQSRLGQWLGALCTHKYLIPFLFVFLVLVWLIPVVQFYSMLDATWYRIMNWSVVISGFFYWYLILDRRPSPPASMSPMGRVLSPLITMTPQIIAGIYISRTQVDLYPLFDLCGRALDFSAIQDQFYGGLMLWIPAAVVESFGTVFALSNWFRLASRGVWLRHR